MGIKMGIIDADLIDNGTRHPNLACMKLSSYYKKLGWDVTLLEDYDSIDSFDSIKISKVFTFTKVSNNIFINNDPEKGLKPHIEIGGTGFFGENAPDLPYEIEHTIPDYHLYDSFVSKRIKNGEKRSKYIDYLDFSIGFTTRGCFRKCPFCVNKKYDRVFRHSMVEEFIDYDRPKIYLWDDNIMASPDFDNVIDELERTGKPFQFRQGLDIRLMTDNKAKRLSKSKYYGDFIFAFDHIEDAELIKSKLKMWRKYCNRSTKLYVLTGYNSQDEVDIANTFERIKIIMEHGCLPYIMRYEKYKDARFRNLYIQIARWCNQPSFFKKKSFRQFCEANEYYHRKNCKKVKKDFCSCYKAMVDFENEFPEIANKYFNLRYEDLNIYQKGNKG